MTRKLEELLVTLDDVERFAVRAVWAATAADNLATSLEAATHNARAAMMDARDALEQVGKPCPPDLRQLLVRLRGEVTP